MAPVSLTCAQAFLLDNRARRFAAGEHFRENLLARWNC